MSGVLVWVIVLAFAFAVPFVVFGAFRSMGGGLP